MLNGKCFKKDKPRFNIQNSALFQICNLEAKNLGFEILLDQINCISNTAVYLFGAAFRSSSPVFFKDIRFEKSHFPNAAILFSFAANFLISNIRVSNGR
jgi:hypothetical protein